MKYLDNEFGEQAMFEEVKKELNILFGKSYKGYDSELQIANMLSACIKRVNEFVKLAKNEELEANLLVYILELKNCIRI